LDLIERNLSERQQREIEALRESNRTFYMVAGLFGGLGLLGIIIAAAIVARAISRFSEVAMSFPAGHAVRRGPEPAALGAGSLSGALPAQFELASAKFTEAMERLEKRIKELEHSSPPALVVSEGVPAGGADHDVPTPVGALDAAGAIAVGAKETGDASTSTISAGGETADAGDASTFLGKGQALLNLGQAEEAIACFNQAITLDPQNADAFLKKGMAMERLQRLEEAIENYDRAIEVNDSVTLAYLYKGAVCNKLQRFREALECYEKALKSEQKTVAA
jgi:tetratricopeptide (TPR) repeat protein